MDLENFEWISPTKKKVRLVKKVRFTPHFDFAWCFQIEVLIESVAVHFRQL